MNLVQIPQIWVNSGVDTKMLLNFLRDLNNNLEVPWLVCVLATLIIEVVKLWLETFFTPNLAQ